MCNWMMHIIPPAEKRRRNVAVCMDTVVVTYYELGLFRTGAILYLRSNVGRQNDICG